MPKSKGRKKQVAKRRPPKQRRPLRDDELPPFDELVAIVLRGGRELIARKDPLDAESWASQMIGLWFKMPLPHLAQVAFNKQIRPAIVERAEKIGSAETLSVLRAFASMEPDPIASPAAAAANRVAARGIRDPSWAKELGTAEFESAWMLTDAYGDADAYYMNFKYPGRKPHVLGATINRNLGGILRDAFVGYSRSDFRPRAEADPRAIVTDVESGVAAARILEAIQIGDEYLDNDWSQDFKNLRSLLLARMRRLPQVALSDRSDPRSEEERRLIVKEFVATLDQSIDVEAAEEIAHHCLRYACDYSCDAEPYRWSPLEVESFLVDWLPRKAMLNFNEIRAMPAVLQAWIRFALEQRGLPAEMIEETQTAVDRWYPEFRNASSDLANFGPAKSIATALLADGIDIRDEASVNAWIAEFNARPQHEREELLGPPGT